MNCMSPELPEVVTLLVGKGLHGKRQSILDLLLNSSEEKKFLSLCKQSETLPNDQLPVEADS